MSEYSKEEVEEKLSELRKKRKNLDRQFTMWSNRLQKIDNSEYEDWKNSNPTFEEKIVRYLNQVHNEGIGEYRDAYAFFKELGFSTHGHFPSTQQRCLQIILYQDDDESVKKTEEALDLIGKYIKPLPEYQAKVFGIFEHTLSENGMYNYLEKEDGTFHVMRTAYGRETLMFGGTGRQTVLEYIQNHHYYE